MFFSGNCALTLLFNRCFFIQFFYISCQFWVFIFIFYKSMFCLWVIIHWWACFHIMLCVCLLSPQVCWLLIDNASSLWQTILYVLCVFGRSCAPTKVSVEINVWSFFIAVFVFLFCGSVFWKFWLKYVVSEPKPRLIRWCHLSKVLLSHRRMFNDFHRLRNYYKVNFDM